MRSSVGAFGVAVGDPSATRTVYTTVALLLGLGIGLIGLAWWLYRATRPDLELLAPLEAMQTKSWRNRDPATQLRLLDEERPDGATPLHAAPQRPDVDSEFATVRPVTSFDDLSDAPEGAEDDVDHDIVAEAEAEGEVDESSTPATPPESISTDADPESPESPKPDGDETDGDDDAEAPEAAGEVAESSALSAIDVAEPAQDAAQDSGDGEVVVDDRLSDETRPSARPADPEVDDETFEIDRPSAVAHDALMLALGRETATVEVMRVDAQQGDAENRNGESEGDDARSDEDADDAAESDRAGIEASGVPHTTID